MFTSQLGPEAAKSWDTMRWKSPHGTMPGNCQIGAEAARALGGRREAETERQTDRQRDGQTDRQTETERTGTG